MLDGDVVAIPFESGCSDEFTTEFCEALAMNRQPRTTLYALYQGWIDAAYALRAAKVTGEFLDSDVATGAKEAGGSFARV